MHFKVEGKTNHAKEDAIRKKLNLTCGKQKYVFEYLLLKTLKSTELFILKNEGFKINKTKRPEEGSSINKKD